MRRNQTLQLVLVSQRATVDISHDIYTSDGGGGGGLVFDTLHGLTGSSFSEESDGSYVNIKCELIPLCYCPQQL